MDLLPDHEQDAVATSAATVLADLDHPARVNRLAELGASRDDELWVLAVSQGWLGLGLPASQGGVGFGPAEQVMLARELGRSLAVGPFLAGMVAAAVTDGDTRASVLGGARVASVVGTDGDSGWLAIDTVDADLLLHVDGERVEVRTFPRSLGAVDGLDPTVGLGTLDIGATEVVARGAAAQVLLASVLRAAALVGIAEAVRDQAVLQAGTREQFGRPIGSFQAIKHTCADLAVAAEAAWRQTCWAALSLRDGHPDADRQVASALLVARHAALDGSAANIQVHGAMGFTAEHTAHLYLKRARVWSAADAMGQVARSTSVRRPL